VSDWEGVGVLHVSQPVDGGVARVVSQLVADQVARGWDVTVACPVDVEAPLGEFLARETREHGATHHEWSAERKPGPQTAAEIRGLARIVAALRPDVVHLHSSKAGLVGRLAVRGQTPTIFQPHAWSFLALGLIAGSVAARWERLATRWCDVILCVSEGERRLGTAAGIRAEWCVIPNGIDLARAPSASELETMRRDVRERFGLGIVPLVVCVGRLSRQKGQDVLLDAWPAVRARTPEARLILVGTGPERQALERRAPAGVLFAGEAADVEEWLAAADVVAVPSRWEGMSLSMLEAMARGCSVVSTDVAGAEALPSGQSAVVPPGDARAFAEALSARLLDPTLREAEGRLNRAAVEATHDLLRTTAETAALYVELAERRARKAQ
jgi:glycosyltransferase involved in cell wall biosynthesis